MKKMTSLLFCIGLSALSLSAAHAQSGYPSASVPIRLVVGVPAGGTPDAIARLMAQKLSTQMNANAVVDNKPGANGNIGAEFVAKSKPDGYTLLVDTNQTILSRAFDQKLGYDVFKDLTPIGLVASSPFALAIHPSIPANTVAEFISYVRANPGKLAFGSGGIGAMSHFGPLIFLQAHGLSALHVPFKGATPALLDLVAGRVQFALFSPAVEVPLAKDKRIKLLAITSLQRSPLLPDLPTLAETGMPGFEIATWYGMMAPAGTPPAIVKRLNNEILRAVQEPDVKGRFEREDLQARNFTPEEYGAYQRSELDRWSKVIKSNNIKLDE